MISGRIAKLLMKQLNIVITPNKKATCSHRWPYVLQKLPLAPPLKLRRHAVRGLGVNDYAFYEYPSPNTISLSRLFLSQTAHTLNACPPSPSHYPNGLSPHPRYPRPAGVYTYGNRPI